MYRSQERLNETIHVLDKTNILDMAEDILKKRKIVIIGAGIAGLAAAKTLEDEGFEDYLLLEGNLYNHCSAIEKTFIFNTLNYH